MVQLELRSSRPIPADASVLQLIIAPPSTAAFVTVFHVTSEPWVRSLLLVHVICLHTQNRKPQDSFKAQASARAT